VCLRVFALFLAGGLFLATGDAVYPADEPVSFDVLALQQAFERAIEKAERSVVCVLISRSPNRSSGRTDPEAVPESYGSGVIIDARGLVLTNYHVIRDAAQIYVRPPGREGGSIEATVRAADPRSDLAVLQVSRASGLEAMTIGDGDNVRKGQLVLSIAHPFAAGFRDGSPSASWGIISNIRRRGPRPQATAERDFSRLTLPQFSTLLQTDARLNLGCSGGALVDLKGEMIGLTTALAAVTGSETAGGYAVPMSAGMKRIIATLKEGKEVEYGFLGVQFESFPRRGGGVQVTAVIPGSPAAEAGLRQGETILRVDGQPIHDNDDVLVAIGTSLAGSTARLQIRGREHPVEVSLAKYYVPGPVIATQRPQAVHGIRVEYTSVLVQRGTGQSVPPGVYVREVEAGSSAERAQLADAVITHVNGHEVNSPAEFYRVAEKFAGPMELTLWSRDEGSAPRKVKLD
jgi:S1-C subfamily serine protease